MESGLALRSEELVGSERRPAKGETEHGGGIAEDAAHEVALE